MVLGKPKNSDTMRKRLQKKIVFSVFPRKKMVLDRKTNFFLGKNGFGQKNQFFPWKKMVFA